MSEFVGGFLWGAGAATALLFIMAKLANDSADRICELQGWQGEACECRNLANREPKP